MWFRFSRPDFFYVGRYRVVDAGDRSPFNRGWSQGFGFFVLHCRWNVGRSETEGVHYADQPRARITINGDSLVVCREAIDYAGIVALAGERHGASVSFYDSEDGRCGDLRPGQRVLLTDSIMFETAVCGAA